MNKITAEHLARRACVYIRQSTPDQVKYNLESKRRQYGLADRARALGWVDIDVIDDDLGISGDGTRRPGFERLLRALCDGQVGAVFCIEASRLARNGREWHTLLDFCSIVGALLIDAETIYDPNVTNDRLLLGMKGTISEMEVATFRERAQAALLQKAQRGALVRRVAIGYVKGAEDRIEKDPDTRVRSTIDLIFRKFAEMGSVRQVYFWLDQQQIQLPIVRGPEDACEIFWQPARYHAVHSVLKNPIYAGAYTYGRSKTVVRLEAGKRVLRQVRLRADRLVSEQLLQCLTPFGTEAAIEAIEALQGASDDRIQQKALALEHARYEVTHARRQYDAVDPANRLVAAELERRWNQALTAEAQLEAELAT